MLESGLHSVYFAMGMSYINMTAVQQATQCGLCVSCRKECSLVALPSAFHYPLAATPSFLHILLAPHHIFLAPLLSLVSRAPRSYQFNQDRYNVEMVALALLKALMQLPENDFTMISYLVPISRVSASCIHACM